MAIEPPQPLKILVDMFRFGIRQLESIAARYPDNEALTTAIAELTAAVDKLERALEKSRPPTPPR